MRNELQRGIRMAIPFVVGVTGLAAPAVRVFDIVPEHSRVVVKVDKAGALSFVAGHRHTVTGPVEGTLSVDPGQPEGASVSIQIPTADLKVSADGEPPEDVPEIQQTMVSAKVLDVERYPSMTFESTAVVAQRRQANVLELMMAGNLTLHGVTRKVAVPVRVEIAERELAATGSLSIEQSDYGIAPVRVAGGMVSVKDDLEITFTIVARG
jgi:polyisoprenoid-binding protein YceI